MREAIRTSQFKRDVKRLAKRGKDLNKLREAIRLLIEEKPLTAQYKDQILTGNWKHHRDLHIEPDWLLIYRVEGTDLILSRTGTHSDIF